MNGEGQNKTQTRKSTAVLETNPYRVPACARAPRGVMGRRKIEVARIANDRHRQVTFIKRRSGIIKKATELAVLCGAEVALIIFSPRQRMSLFSSVPIEDMMRKFSNYNEAPEVRTPTPSPHPPCEPIAGRRALSRSAASQTLSDRTQ